MKEFHRDVGAPTPQSGTAAGAGAELTTESAAAGVTEPLYHAQMKPLARHSRGMHGPPHTYSLAEYCREAGDLSWSRSIRHGAKGQGRIRQRSTNRGPDAAGGPAGRGCLLDYSPARCRA